MRRLRRSWVILLAGCAAPQAVPDAPAAPLEEPAAEVDTIPQTTSAVAEAFFAHLEADDFEGAAAMFHYRPGADNASERQRQRREITHFLQVLTAEMGRVTARRTATNPGEILFGSIGSGTVDYWRGFPAPVFLVYEVDVENDGGAYVQLGFAPVDGKIALRSVGFGLPSSRPGAAERMERVLDRAFAAPQ